MNLTEQDSLINRIQGIPGNFNIRRVVSSRGESFVAVCGQCKANIAFSQKVFEVCNVERSMQYAVTLLADHRKKCILPEVLFQVKQQPNPEPPKPFSRRFDFE